MTCSQHPSLLFALPVGPAFEKPRRRRVIVSPSHRSTQGAHDQCNDARRQLQRHDAMALEEALSQAEKFRFGGGE